MSEIELDANRGTMPDNVAQPDGAGPWSGVAVIHDAAGTFEGLRQQAVWLAILTGCERRGLAPRRRVVHAVVVRCRGARVVYVG